MRQIPFGKPLFGEEEYEAVRKVLASGILVHGPVAKQFEDAFASYTGAKYAVSVSSCTAAMHLYYFQMGLREGDEVIVPAQTHVATAHAVELCGAKPVFIDAELLTGNIDIDLIEKQITTRTKAIAVVHFLGMPVDMQKLRKLADKYGIPVLEDCALALGTRLDGVHAGLFGDCGCFSFYPVKHMTTTEGGMLITNNERLAWLIEKKKAFGVDRNFGERQYPGIYDVPMLGFNYRMNEMQAALGIQQLKRMDGFLEKRKRNYEELEKNLVKIDEIRLFSSHHDSFQNSYYCLSILLKDELTSVRYELMDFLKKKGVGSSVYYPKPVPHMKYYQEKYGYHEGMFPQAAKISSSSIALPVGPHLEHDDITYITESLKDSLCKVKRT